MGLRARRLHRVLRRHPLPGLPGAVRRRGRHARRRRPAAQAARRLAGVGQAARRQRPGLPAGQARTASSTGPVAKNITDDERAGIAAHVGAQPGDCIFFAAGPPKSSRALLGAARLEIGRRCGLIDEARLELPLGRRRPAVRAGRRGDRQRRRRGRLRRLDGGAPRVHQPEAGVPRHLRHRPRQRAGLRLRHRLQRQRDRRRVDPYPPRGRPEAGLRGDGHRRGGGAGEVRLPARRLQVRRAAARRDRVRLGPDRARCSPAPSRSAT